MKNNFSILEDEVIIKISKTIYEKKVLVQACYVKLENFYFLIDQEDDYFLISFRFKDQTKNSNKELENAAYEFFDELIESASYIEQLKNTNSIRSRILEAALLPHSIETSKNEDK